MERGRERNIKTWLVCVCVNTDDKEQAVCKLLAILSKHLCMSAINSVDELLNPQQKMQAGRFASLTSQKKHVNINKVFEH